ncbi:alpha/beta hydrolase family protein [Saccharospirillum alexandrii]|uniref:alpha/beta hydrolase family protein n=1 Tax=Saccharospirillum alexandrii TaxID=2448477 RepID=UPI00373689A4
MKTLFLPLAVATLMLTGCNTSSSEGDSAPMSFEPRINPTDVVRGDAPELAALGSHETGVTTLTVVNENQIDLASSSEDDLATYDRSLTLEVWYPAEAVSDEVADRTSTAITRDAETLATLRGRAARDATPLYSEGPFPLILVSHGYPGNRYLMSHFGENLSSKGFVVVAIDHMESTYSDQTVFASTLLNRSLDQNFVLGEMAQLSNDNASKFSGLIDTNNAGIIGYSMGGYGAINTVGGGLSEGATALPFGTATQMGQLSQRQLSDPEYQASVDARFKAAIAIGPWGNQVGMWDAAGLANIDVPVMVIGGSVDDVSNYEGGIKPLYQGLSGIDKYLLTFQNANHNAAAPMAAPQEVYATGDGFDHYADAVWDNTRMNNITQHFATAFFEQYLKGEDRSAYFDLIPLAQDGDEEAGTTWKGFKQRDAVGLEFEFELK